MGVESSTAVLQEHIDYLQKSKREAVAAAIAAEREACAKIAMTWGERQDQMTDTAFVPGANHGERYASNGIAAAIRARGKT